MNESELEESKTAKELGTPSIIGNYVPAGTTGTIMISPGGSGGKHNPAGTVAGRVVHSGGGIWLYSEALGGGTTIKRFHLTVERKGTHPPGKIKELLRTKVSPIEMQVGLNKFKLLNKGKVIIWFCIPVVLNN